MGWGMYLLLYYLLNIRSFPRILQFACRRYRQRTFALDVEEGSSISYRELCERVGDIAGFVERVCEPDQAVSFIGENSIDYFLVRSACIVSHRPFLAIHPHLDGVTISAIMESAGSVLLFYSKAVTEAQLPRKEGIICKKVRDVQAGRMISRSGSAPTFTYNLSSATTARVPKLIKISERAWVNSFYNYLLLPGREKRRFPSFLCLPPFSGAGSVSFLPMLMSGGRYVIAGSREPSAVYDLIEREGVDMVYMPPAFFSRFVAFCKRRRLRPNCEVLVGSDRVNPNAVRVAVQDVGMKVVVSYGMAEVLPPLTYYSPMASDDLEGFGSVGRVVPMAQVALDAVPDRRFRSQGIGRIRIKANTVADGYPNDPEQSEKVFRDGWFISNDFGRFDGRGRLHVLGRDVEIMELDGVEVFSSEVEYAIARDLGGVLNLRCVKADRGEVVVFVERDSLLEQGERYLCEEVEKVVRENFSVDCRVEFMDSLPTTFAGKIDVVRLKELANGQ